MPNYGLQIPAGCDVNIWKPFGHHIKVASAFEDQGQGSHVLLAACSVGEKAGEHVSGGQGIFTRALVKSLSTEGVKHYSYISLMHSVKDRV